MDHRENEFLINPRKESIPRSQSQNSSRPREKLVRQENIKVIVLGLLYNVITAILFFLCTERPKLYGDHCEHLRSAAQLFCICQAIGVFVLSIIWVLFYKQWITLKTVSYVYLLQTIISAGVMAYIRYVELTFEEHCHQLSVLLEVIYGTTILVICLIISYIYSL